MPGNGVYKCNVPPCKAKRMHEAESVASCLMALLLDETAVADELATLPEWALKGKEISRSFRFPSYMAGIAFVNEVARVADEADHHPDIFVGWRLVVLNLSTHSKGGLTNLDFELARKADALFARLPLPSGPANG